jgi:hypothetical protein
VVHACNPRIQETKEGGLRVVGLGYIVRSCLRKEGRREGGKAGRRKNPVISATQEAKIKRITVQDHKVSKTPSQQISLAWCTCHPSYLGDHR